MKPVYQTRFGGPDDPEEEQGNCMQAALASIFEVRLEDAPDFTGEIVNGKWFLSLEAWLARRNLELVVVGAGCHFTPPVEGYYIQCVESTTLGEGEGHTVVAKNGQVVHDPNQRAASIGKVTEHWFFSSRKPELEMVV